MVLSYFEPRHTVSMVIATLSLLVQAASLVLAREGLDSNRVLAESTYLLPVLVLCMAMTLVLLLLPRSRIIRPVILLAKIILLHLVLIPIPYLTPLKALLVSAYIMECILVLASPWDLLAGTLAIVLLAATQQDRKVWDTFIGGARLDEVMGLVLFPAMIMGLAWGFKHCARSLGALQNEVDRLQEGAQHIIMANVSFQELAQEVEEASMERERKRISREIHDVVGYTLTNQYMALEAAQILLNQPQGHHKLKALLSNAQDQAQEGLSEVRSALHQLRTQAPPPMGFLNRLTHICKTFQNVTGVVVHCYAPIRQEQISSGHEMVLYRIVQAGLTNSFLHGRASSIEIVLQAHEHTIHLSIQDNGKGAEDISEGIGLAGMRERISPFGGTLGYTSTDSGFLVEVYIPLTENKEHQD